MRVTPLTHTSEGFDRLIRRRDAANYLQAKYGFGTEKTLAKYAVTGEGPIYRIAGRFPLYNPADLDSWAQARISKPLRSTREYD